ncbi:MAG: CAP domain-containing protein [Lawsonella sp.]|nr:CAP domain-containing protein [Mycobacteriales bacterium]
MKKLIAGIALAATLVAPTAVTPVATAAPAETLTAEQQASVAKNLFHQTNQVRKQAGKRPLAWDEQLAADSTKWSAYQARIGELQHDTTQMMGFYHAENVFWVSDNHPELAVEAWRDSPGHYRNMVGDYRRVGIGMAQDWRGGWYVTQRFLR